MFSFINALFLENRLKYLAETNTTFWSQWFESPIKISGRFLISVKSYGQKSIHFNKKKKFIFCVYQLGVKDASRTFGKHLTWTSSYIWSQSSIIAGRMTKFISATATSSRNVSLAHTPLILYLNYYTVSRLNWNFFFFRNELPVSVRRLDGK